MKAGLLALLVVLAGCGGARKAVPTEPEFDWPDAGAILDAGG